MNGKSKEKKKCPHCNKETLIKYGIDKGIQKYKCKNPDCKKISRDQNCSFKIKNKTQKAIISALMELIESEYDSTRNKTYTMDMKYILNPELVDDDEFKKLKFRYRAFDRMDTYGMDSKDNGTKNINCFNPKVVLCKTGNTIEIIKLPEFHNKELSQKINKYKYKRTVCLVNSYKYLKGKIKSKHNIRYY